MSGAKLVGYLEIERATGQGRDAHADAVVTPSPKNDGRGSNWVCDATMGRNDKAREKRTTRY